jgi:hypothetical protein
MAGVDYKGFEAGDDTVIWRYMPSARYRDLLEGRLHFAAAHQFGDRFEGAITQAEQARRRQMAEDLSDDEVARERELRGLSEAFGDLRRMTKISCWHARAHENLAMWERYRPEAGYAVAVASTVGALKSSLQPFRLQPTYGEETIRLGAVRYIDYAREEMRDRSTLGVFLHKRVEYSDEREVRALLSLTMAVEFGVVIPHDGVVVTVEPSELVHEVRVDAHATEDDVTAVVAATRDARVLGRVARSTLGAEPVY